MDKSIVCGFFGPPCISELEEGLAVAQNHPLTFWIQRTEHSFKLIAGLALDLVAAPASQAFIERIFVVCGMLTQARCNKICRLLEMRISLKLNIQVLGDVTCSVIR